ncbi:MAG: hypothetical protein IKJ13_00415 [Clostridia bacterium]|nr:hypothetical protein [Clostridia bacterium]
MQRKLIFLLLLVTTLVFAFVGCKVNKDSGGNNINSGGSNNPTEDNNEAIYAPSKPFNIVFGDGCSEELALNLQEAVYWENDVMAKVSSSNSATDTEHTIFIGRTGSELSDKAYELLDDMIEEAKSSSLGEPIIVGYVYYVKGNSLAIAFSEDLYDSTVDVALDAFIEDYVRGNPTLVLEKCVQKKTYDYLEFLKTIDEKYYGDAWNKLSDEIKNPELLEALKKLKNLYGSEVVTWIANLYDEEIGGFYYSNSGRNNQGFLPDVDSTYQALVLVGHTGMQSDFGYGSATWPEGLLEKVGSFAKRLQDENGFFYHPQWTKELTDSKTTRRARDLERALALIKWAGMTPTYDAPDGTKGDGLVWNDKLQSFVPDENLTEPMSSSVASAVSKVVSVNTTYIPNELKTEAAFRSYLASKEGQNMYKVNHELASLATQIKERDRQLEKDGQNWRIAPILIQWLNNKQNSENGTWSSETNYNAVDGLFKGVSIYDALGYELPNAMKAALTALNAITSDEDTGSAITIYNCWSTVLLVMNNMKQFGAPENAKTVLNEVRKVAAKSVEATLEKQIAYAKSDRSFSYYKDSCATESQGMQVALSVNEGDMNATSLSYSIWGTIFACLDISDLEIAIHASADYALFVETIVGIGGVIKDPVPEPETVTFDDDSVGSASTEVTYTLASDGAFAQVIQDPRAGVSGNVLELTSNPGAGDAVFVNVADKVSLGTCFIFEGEFCVADAKDGYVMQVNLGSSCYMLNLKVVDATDEDGNAYKKIQILESSSQVNPRIERDLGISSRLGEWFKLRYEYYVGSHDSVRIKVYFNDTLAAVTDNYYDHNGVKITSGTGSPKQYYNYTQMNVMAAQQATVLMDNLFVAKTEDRYVPEHDLDNQPLINCDPPDRDELIYNFDDLNSGKNYPNDFTVTENEGVVEVVASSGENKLNIKSLGSQNAPSFYLPAVTRTARTNCAVAEMNVIANSGSVGSSVNIRFRADDKISGDTGAIVAFNLEIAEIDGETCVVVTEAPNGNTVSQFANTKVRLGEEFKLRIEYYEDAHVSLVYLNETLAASSDALASGGGARSYARLEISALEGGNIDVLIDDLKAERIVKSFLEATKPTKDEIVYDFESGVGDAETDGKIIGSTTGKALSLVQSSVITLPMNERAVITNFYRLSFDADFGKQAEYRIAFLSETGKYVLAFDFVSKDGKVIIYEFTENGRAAKPISSFDAVSMANLSFEYYPKEKVCQIIYSNNCVAVTSVTYSGESRHLNIDKASVISLSDSGAFIVDNCICECYNTSFVPRDVVGDNEEDGAQNLTFESSSSGNIPSAITYKLTSLGADVRIEELLDKTRNVTKALVFDSTSDAGGDEVSVKITDPSPEEWNVLVFESDIRFNANNVDKISYQIFFEGESSPDTTRQYLTSIAHANGKLKVQDYSYGSSTSTVQVDGQDAKVYRNDGPAVGLNSIGNVTDWFTLRIEIYKGDRENMRVFTYINDTLVYVTNNFYLSHLSENPNDLTNVTKVRILALYACEASLIMDNVSLTQTTKEKPADSAIGATVRLYQSTNKPILPAPVIPEDKDIPETIHYDTDRVYSNTQGEDKNGTEQPKLVVKDGKLNFITDGGDYLYITPTVKSGSYNHSSFEADLTFTFDTSLTTGKATYYTFTAMSDDKKNSFRFNIEYNIDTGEITFTVFNNENTYGSSQMKKVIGTPGEPGKESITLNYKLEYYFIGSDIVILNYFDGNLVYAVNSRENQSYKTADGVSVDYNTYFYYNSTTPTKPYNTFGRIGINSLSGKGSTLTLDNLRFVQDNKTLDENLIAPKPGTLIKGTTGEGVYYNKVGGYEFNVTDIWKEIDLNNASATKPFVWRSAGGAAGRYVHITKASAGDKYSYIQIASQGTDKSLEYGQATSSSTASSIYLKSTESSGNFYVFETDILIGTVSGLEDGDVLLSFFLGTEHNKESMFFENLKIIKVSENQYSLAHSAEKVYAQMDASNWYNIALEYYYETNTAVYYVNGTEVGREAIVYDGEIGAFGYASVSICEKAYDAFIRLDNTVISAFSDPEHCAHVDSNVDRICDKCDSTYYDPNTCDHVDDNLDTVCDNCYSVYYTEQTCPEHTDTNGDTVCDNCGCKFADPATCRHTDNDNNSICDKCETTYYNPATCEHRDEDEDGECDRCGLSTKPGGSIGGEFENENSWT